VIIRSRELPSGWHIQLVQDVDNNRYIEATCQSTSTVVTISPSHKLWNLFDAVLKQNPVIQDEELVKLYGSSTKGISHHYGRVLAYGRAVIEITRKTWGVT
jgi:hypothetical protein